MNANFKLFHNEVNDDVYWEWMRLNPNGYIVNPKRNTKTNDFKYHKPGCPHIADRSPISRSSPRVSGRYVLMDLSEVLAELKKYKSYNGVFAACNTCKPDLR